MTLVQISQLINSNSQMETNPQKLQFLKRVRQGTMRLNNLGILPSLSLTSCLLGKLKLNQTSRRNRLKLINLMTMSRRLLAKIYMRKLKTLCRPKWKRIYPQTLITKMIKITVTKASKPFKNNNTLQTIRCNKFNKTMNMFKNNKWIIRTLVTVRSSTQRNKMSVIIKNNR